MVKFSVIAASVAMALGIAISNPAQAWDRGGWDQHQTPHYGYRAPAAPPVYQRHYRPQPYAYGPPPWRRRWAHGRRGYDYHGPRGWW